MEFTCGERSKSSPEAAAPLGQSHPHHVEYLEICQGTHTTRVRSPDCSTQHLSLSREELTTGQDEPLTDRRLRVNGIAKRTPCGSSRGKTTVGFTHASFLLEGSQEQERHPVRLDSCCQSPAAQTQPEQTQLCSRSKRGLLQHLH